MLDVSARDKSNDFFNFNKVRVQDLVFKNKSESEREKKVDHADRRGKDPHKYLIISMCNFIIPRITG